MNPIYNFIKKNSIGKIGFVSAFIAIFLTCYFLIFAIYGDKGLKDLLELQKEIEEKRGEEKSLSLIRKAKEERVNKMQPDSLDLDLLDEQARKSLGYADSQEVIIYDKKSSKNPKINQN